MRRCCENKDSVQAGGGGLLLIAVIDLNASFCHIMSCRVACWKEQGTRVTERVVIGMQRVISCASVLCA